MYAYRAFIETELNYQQAQKSSFLESAGYALDAPANHIDDATNRGFLTRGGWFGNSVSIQLMGSLHTDLSSQERYMLNNTAFRIELYRNSDQFALLCFADQAENYKIIVEDVRLWIKRVDLAPQLTLAMEATLLRNMAKYPIRRVQVKAVHLPGNRLDTLTTAVISGQIPCRIIIGLVANLAYHGDYAFSPFNFQHFDCSSIYLMAGGIQYPPVPLEMRYGTNDFKQPYVQLHEVLQFSSYNLSPWINLEEYKNGQCFYGFDLSTDSSDNGVW